MGFVVQALAAFAELQQWCGRPDERPKREEAKPVCGRPDERPKREEAKPVCGRPDERPKREEAKPVCGRPMGAPKREEAKPHTDIIHILSNPNDVLVVAALAFLLLMVLIMLRTQPWR